MRVLVFSSYWPRPLTAIKAYFEVDQVGAFLELGHEVDVLIQTEPWRRGARYMAPAELGLDSDRVRIHQITVPRFPEVLARRKLGALINLWAAGRRLRAWLSKYEARYGPADAILVHGERNAGLSVGIWNADRSRPVVMIIHGADPALEAFPGPFLEQYFGNSVSMALHRIVLVGNRLRPYAAHIGYDPARITVIPNGFRHPAIPENPICGDMRPVRLVAAARLIPVKGLDDALQALARLRKSRPELDWRFDILGDGTERRALEDCAERLELNAYVCFHGAVTHEQVLQTLEKCAIFVLPSWNEAFGLAYLEAMAMGAAVIGCHGNGAADIITDGVDGRLVPPRDVTTLAVVLEQLISDPTQREALAKAAMDSVKRYSWSANALALMKTISDG